MLNWFELVLQVGVPVFLYFTEGWHQDTTFFSRNLAVRESRKDHQFYKLACLTGILNPVSINFRIPGVAEHRHQCHALHWMCIGNSWSQNVLVLLCDKMQVAVNSVNNGVAMFFIRVTKSDASVRFMHTSLTPDVSWFLSFIFLVCLWKFLSRGHESILN